MDNEKMESSDEETMLEQEDEKLEKSDYDFKKIGGFDIISKRSIFSYNGNYLIVPTNDIVRIFVVKTGQLLIKININCTQNEEIVSLQLHPIYYFSQIIIFTSHGRFIIYDYLDRLIVKDKSFLFEKKERTNYATILYLNHMKKYFLFFNKFIMKSRDSQIYFFELSSPLKPSSETEGKTSSTTKNFANFIDREAKYLPFNKMLLKFGDNGIAFGDHNSLLFLIHETALLVLKLDDNAFTNGITTSAKHLISVTEFKCVTASNNSEYVAAGDTIGRIFMYTANLLTSKPIRTILHWHSCDISSIKFSPESNYLYSCGYESVLVRWSMSDLGSKNYLPRLGFPLKTIMIDDNNEYIALSRHDNSIIFIGSNFNDPMRVIEGLSYGYTDTERSDVLTGLNWDENSKSLMLNGRNGQLQFYSPYLEKQLFQLDITDQNFLITNCNKPKIYRIEVTHAAISVDGKWLATIEYRDDNVNLPEIRLKFWSYLSNKNHHKLNTILHLPHTKNINKIKFSPKNNFLVTTSNDGDFRLWYLIHKNDSEEGKLEKDDNIDDKYWICGKSELFNQYLTPKCIAISDDSSLVVISYDDYLTIWDNNDVEKMVYLETLKAEQSNDDKDEIKKVDFASKDRSHFVIEMKNKSLTCWNILSLTVAWTWTVSQSNVIDYFTIDLMTNNIALFTRMGKLEILDIDCNHKLTTNTPCKNKIITSAIFIPRKVKSINDILFENSHLCFLNTEQELFTLIKKLNNDEVDKQDDLVNNIELDINGDKLRLANDYIQKTPLSILLANQKAHHLIKGVSEVDLDYRDINELLSKESNYKNMINDMFFNVPSHVLPPIERISKHFLRSLLNGENNEFDNKYEHDVEMKEINNDESVDYSDQDDEYKKLKKDDINLVENNETTTTKKLKDKKASNFNDFIFTEDYSWIKL